MQMAVAMSHMSNWPNRVGICPHCGRGAAWLIWAADRLEKIRREC